MKKPKKTIYIIPVRLETEDLLDSIERTCPLAGQCVEMELAAENCLDVVFGSYSRAELSKLPIYEALTSYGLSTEQIQSTLHPYIDKLHALITARTGVFPSATMLKWKLRTFDELYIYPA